MTKLQGLTSGLSKAISGDLAGGPHPPEHQAVIDAAAVRARRFEAIGTYVEGAPPELVSKKMRDGYREMLAMTT